MAEKIFKIRILLSSPGNMDLDRKIVRETVDRINLDSGNRSGFYAEVIGWDTHTRPSISSYPQQAINEQFPEDIDIFVGLMGSHFGTTTREWGSGTEEEFRIAFGKWKSENKPEIMFYFSEAAINPKSIDPKQLEKRNNFKKELPELGVLYFEYEDSTQLQYTLYKHINDAIHSALEKREKSTQTEFAPSNDISPLSNYEKLVSSTASIAITLLSESSVDGIKEFTNLANSLTDTINRFTRKLDKGVKKLDRGNKENNMKLIMAGVSESIDALSMYRKKLTTTIPSLQSSIEQGITGAQRAFTLANESKIPISLDKESVADSLIGLKTSLTYVEAMIDQLNSSMDGWPENIQDLYVQKLMLHSLHQDFKSFIKNAVDLIDQFVSDLTESTGFIAPAEIN